MPPIHTLASIFPSWRGICTKYDEICDGLNAKHPTKESASQKEESIHWEQTAFELLLTILVSLKIEFMTDAECVQKIVKTVDGIDKEIDFSITIDGTELYFGVTSFSDSEKDFAKDVADAHIPITDITRPDGTFSDNALITSVRPQRTYMNRRLVVRVAKEGKHRLNSDYIYIAFPKIAPGFGKGLDAIAKDFSFDDGDYTYQENGITGLMVIGEYLRVQPKLKSIEHDVWLVKTKAFPHASEKARSLLNQLDGITVDMRLKFQEVRRFLATSAQDMSNCPLMP